VPRESAASPPITATAKPAPEEPRIIIHWVAWTDSAADLQGHAHDIPESDPNMFRRLLTTREGYERLRALETTNGVLYLPGPPPAIGDDNALARDQITRRAGRAVRDTDALIARIKQLDETHRDELEAPYWLQEVRTLDSSITRRLERYAPDVTIQPPDFDLDGVLQRGKWWPVVLVNYLEARKQQLNAMIGE
jgi:hypothetical protein